MELTYAEPSVGMYAPETVVVEVTAPRSPPGAAGRDTVLRITWSRSTALDKRHW
jgi:hypothetical protein